MTKNLDELLATLGEEPTPEIDWDAPEAGSFPPGVAPGSHEFVFHLREDEPFDTVVIPKEGGKPYLSVIFDAEVTDSGDPKKVTYQRVNTYKHKKMAISSAGELLRSLSLRPASNPPSNREIVELLQGASGRAKGRGEVAWRFYCKAHNLTICTSPRKRKGVKDTAWPRNTDGTFQLAVQCPKCGEHSPKQFGREEFVNFFSPSGETN